ncbi:MAG: ATP-dependent zinc metalloprotease FtsH [Candidatus Dependentiae bacterium ADurb.Bin331]|nr:MAG: ATP-dependent zinc metalloprotease FtsH [Candidatus Dependentiae bacterium ADurb.Bin331]
MGKHVSLVVILLFINVICVTVRSNDLPCASYAQEVTQQTIDDDLIFHLLSTCPKLRRLVYRLQDPVRYGKNVPTKILLVGPPGVGKTTLSKGIASLISRQYKFLRASLLVNEYKNSGPQNLAREILPILQSKQPYVIIVDEIHSLCENYKKEQNSDPGTAEALWSILDECTKNPQILFIGTTNDATNLPEPLKTRFANCVIEIPLPNVAQRKRIIKYYLRNTLCDFDDVYITKLAKQTNHLAGRNLEQLVSDALLYALDRADIPLVRKKDFERALREMSKNEQFLQMTGLGKYTKYIKDHANLVLQAVNIALGLGLQYWSMQRQMAFQKTAHEEQKKAQANFNADQKKMQEDQFTTQKNQQIEWHKEEVARQIAHHDRLEFEQLEHQADQLALQEKNAKDQLNQQKKSSSDQLAQSSTHSFINMGLGVGTQVMMGAYNNKQNNSGANETTETTKQAAAVGVSNIIKNPDAAKDILGKTVTFGKNAAVAVKNVVIAHPYIAAGIVVVGVGYCVYRWYNSGPPKIQPQPSPA